MKGLFEKSATEGKTGSLKECDKIKDSEKLGDTLSINSATVRAMFKMDANKSRQGKNNCCTFVEKKKIQSCVEKTFIIFICMVIAGGFTVPIIIYGSNTDRGKNTTLTDDLNLDSCSNASAQVCKMMKGLYSCVRMYSVMSQLSSYS